MERILAELVEVSSRVRTLEEKRHKLGLFLREIKAAQIVKSTDVLEDRMAIPVASDSLDKLRVAGIDGGLIKHPYHAVDLILTRAVAAIFDYGRGALTKVDYFPDPLANPRLSVITDPYSDTDFLNRADVERMITEAAVLAEIGQQNPDLVLIDGSLLPHPSSRPKKGSAVWPRYEELVKLYQKTLADNGFLLAGIIEDSRSTHFSELVAQNVLGNIQAEGARELQDILSRTKDTNLLFHVLKPGERSFVFRLGTADNPVVSDLGENGKNVYAFYLKTVEYDRPIRVEFYAEKNVLQIADRIAALVLPMSSQNQEYGIPAVIIEADSRAKLKEEELSTIHSYILDHVGDLPSLYKLRRDSRPF